MRLTLLTALLCLTLWGWACSARRPALLEAPQEDDCNYDRWYFPGLPKQSACQKVPA